MRRVPPWRPAPTPAVKTGDKRKKLSWTVMTSRMNLRKRRKIPKR